MMKNIPCEDYMIVTGGSEADSYDSEQKLLRLKCNDRYEGLPEKVVKLCEFFNTEPAFSSYSHLCKLDDDMWVRQVPDKKSLRYDYAGRVKNYFCDRKYHWGKCSSKSNWNTREYQGEIPPFCLGGHGYLLSRKATLFVAKDKRFVDEIYEDVYVSKVLRENGIRPTRIWGLKKYFYSPKRIFNWFYESFYATQSFNYYPYAW